MCSAEKRTNVALIINPVRHQTNPEILRRTALHIPHSGAATR
jgi:hypothetical protein